jgi:hypothetical protein
VAKSVLVRKCAFNKFYCDAVCRDDADRMDFLRARNQELEPLYDEKQTKVKTLPRRKQRNKEATSSRVTTMKKTRASLLFIFGLLTRKRPYIDEPNGKKNSPTAVFSGGLLKLRSENNCIYGMNTHYFEPIRSDTAPGFWIEVLLELVVRFSRGRHRRDYSVRRS